jgi:hypothetical protein
LNEPKTNVVGPLPWPCGSLSCRLCPGIAATTLIGSSGGRADVEFVLYGLMPARWSTGRRESPKRAHAQREMSMNSEKVRALVSGRTFT